MNLITGIILLMLLLMSVFIVRRYVAFYINQYTKDKEGYENDIALIEKAISDYQVNNSSYFGIIKMLKGITKYRYQDYKRNDKAAADFKQKYWRHM